MAKSKKNKPERPKTKILFMVSLSFAVLGLLLLFPFFYFSDKSLPNTFVNNIDIGLLSADKISQKLESEISTPDKILIKTKESNETLDLKDIDFSYDFNKTASNIISSQKYKGIPNLLAVFNKKEFHPEITLDTAKLDEYLHILQSSSTKSAKPYSVKLSQGKIIVDKGQSGESIDIQRLNDEIINNLKDGNVSEIVANYVDLNDNLSDSEAQELKDFAGKFIGRYINLTNEYNTFTISDKTIISFLAKGGQINKSSISEYISKNITPDVERPPQNATFVYESGKVNEFSPARNGLKIENEKLVEMITAEITDLPNNNEKNINITIPVTEKPADITLADVNNLGLKDLIGRGISYFKGSIPSRVFNIGHASAKFNSILVGPGETFSFDNILGDVSALTGYKQAYIIQNGRTVLGDGGGVCQVSTTLFRAVLNAGLPVIERRAHSYRVGYYEQGSPPGIDATVFYPTTDFKFKNDTPANILIQTMFDPKKYQLVFEIYGTSDGRSSVISKPVVSNVTAPPEDLYIDDPTLPTGQIKQVDYKAWGARVSFNYKVTRDGQTLTDKNFVSNYQPWQAIFLRGTGPSI